MSAAGRVKRVCVAAVVALTLCGGPGLAFHLPVVGAVREQSHPSIGVISFRLSVPGEPESQSEIWAMNADGTNLRRVTCNNRDDQASEWSPDGQTLAFYSQEQLPGGRPVQNTYLVDPRAGCGPGVFLIEGRFPSWSPVMRKVAFDRGFRDPVTGIARRDIFVLSPDGTEVNVTNNPEARNIRADWSPDGTRIVFARGQAEESEDIWVMNADGTGMQQLTDDPAGDNAPQWSPDGRTILFQSDRDEAPGLDEIYVMNPDGSGQTRLTFRPGRDASPQWSPNGRQIVFHGRDPVSGVPHLFIMNADGSGLHQITAQIEGLPISAMFPAWGAAHIQAETGEGFAGWLVRSPSLFDLSRLRRSVTRAPALPAAARGTS